MSYYYPLSKNKQQHYTSNGLFACPAITQQLKAEYGYIGTDHDQAWTGGRNHVYYKQGVRTELPNGDVEISSSRVIQKVTKDRKDLMCKCGQAMVFIGYATWQVTVLAKGKNISLAGLGTANVGGKEKRTPRRYFKNKAAMLRYVRAKAKK